MELCLQATEAFLISFPCFLSCFFFVQTCHQSNSRKPPVLGFSCALLFSAISALLHLFLPSFLAYTLALFLSGPAGWLLVRRSLSLYRFLSILFFSFLAVTLLELAVGMLLVILLRCFHLTPDTFSPSSLSIGCSLGISAVVSVLGRRRIRLFHRLGRFSPPLVILCCGLLSLSFIHIAHRQHPLLFHSLLLLLLLLVLLLCLIGVREQRQKCHLKEELLAKNAELTRQAAEVKLLHTEIHNYRSLVCSTKSKVDDMAKLVSHFHSVRDSLGTEFAEEFDSLREDTLAVYEITAKHAETELLLHQILPKTGFSQLDLLLEDCLQLCMENGILLNASIMSPFTEERRPRELPAPLLASMIAEHVLDAIRAIRRSGREQGEVNIVIGFPKRKKKEENVSYSIDIFDNGEPFSLEILGRLGENSGVSTGGTGIGFPTTLKRLALCNGSLSVRDLDPGQNGGMTACVSLVFDGKRRFEILSDTRQEEVDTLRRENRMEQLIFTHTFAG